MIIFNFDSIIESTMKNVVIGIHDGHGSSVAVVHENTLLFAASEERYTRVKNQCGFPYAGIHAAQQFCKQNNLNITAVACAGKYASAPMRICDTLYRKRGHSSPYSATARIGMFYQSQLSNIRIIRSIDHMISHAILSKKLKKAGLDVPLTLVEHHLAHVMTTATDPCSCVTMDAFGDGKSGVIGYYKNNTIHIYDTFTPKNSLAYAYGLFTHCYGFKEGQEGKLMGLASYGNSRKYMHVLKKLIHFSENKPWLNPVIQNRMFKKWLFSAKTVGFARAIEHTVNEYIVKLAKYACSLTHCKNVAVSGGLFLNVSSNSALLESDIDDLYLFPNAGDGGLSFGAARFVSKKVRVS